MLEIKQVEDSVALVGRFSATEVSAARAVFDAIDTSIVVDLRDMEYIASAGLRVLLATQKRLSLHGAGLKLIRPNQQVLEILTISGFTRIFDGDW